MQVEEFLSKVRERAGLQDTDQARQATDAVLETLRARISREGADNVAPQLPKQIREMWEISTLERIKSTFAGTEHLDLSGFMTKIAVKGGYDDVNQTEVITRAVLTTLREQITPGAQNAVAVQLPNDIREYWESCEPSQVHTGRPEQPIEMEAPVEAEQAGARPWGPETDLPTGADTEMEAPVAAEEGGIEPEREVYTGRDVEMIEASTEALMRDVNEACEECSASEMWVAETEHAAEVPESIDRDILEEEVEPPAVERIEKLAPPEERVTAEGPGSPAHYRSDPEIAKEIEALLRHTDEVDPKDIDVFVLAGNVELRGHVRSEAERDAAGRTAAKALGVGDILNELKVED